MNSFSLIYEVVRRIPPGKVLNYGEVALRAGNPRWSRVVGYALHVNPAPGNGPDLGLIPCHRVVMRNGALSPAFAFGGENHQRALLAAEGVSFTADGCVDMKRHLWREDETKE